MHTKSQPRQFGNKYCKDSQAVILAVDNLMDLFDFQAENRLLKPMVISNLNWNAGFLSFTHCLLPNEKKIGRYQPFSIYILYRY